MIMGSLPFLVIAQTSLNNLFAILKDHQVQTFLLILLFSILSIYYFANEHIIGDNFDKFV